MASSPIPLPGEDISKKDLPAPKSKSGALILGPGLRLLPPTTVTATNTGTLVVENKKSAVWLENAHGRYLPAVGDLIIAQVHHGGGDAWACAITPHTPFATLGHLAFEAVNKKTRPSLKNGDLVYARISKCRKGEDVELECVNPTTGKADGMGPLKDGMVFDLSPQFVRRLMMGTGADGKNRGNVIILEEVGQTVRFEVAVGRNGRIWIESGRIPSTIAVGRLLTSCDQQRWDLETQRKEVKKVLKGLGS